ncbi:hypothetical protein [Halodesulfovibrio sp.]|jgi:hypothetical protein|uniref:hypothetical protein n=1 Tax=Halodesulfovibrio sp. TaxID=1912772 RepID=UPI0025E4D3CA|nr:hypothetical protein [Halodesulfovibrio sp.]MCT4627927.1 hypothetical protein [Halodesulfovibrio sp.]
MPIERWECEYCEDIFDPDWECEDHEDNYLENPQAQLKNLLADKCVTCTRCSMSGLHYR